MGEAVTKIVLVVAVAKNGVIGRDGDMPWRLSTDLQRFKAITMGRPIIMGRKTWDSIGRPLPGRLSIIVTRQGNFVAAGAETAPSLKAAIDIAVERAGDGDIFIVGGGQIYAESMAIADTLHVTHVDATVKGDAVFPPIDAALWQVAHEEIVSAGEKDDFPTRYALYQRR